MLCKKWAEGGCNCGDGTKEIEVIAMRALSFANSQIIVKLPLSLDAMSNIES